MFETGGTFECVLCGETFTKQIPCCCDEGLFDDGSHTDGVCTRCCEHPKVPRGDY